MAKRRINNPKQSEDLAKAIVLSAKINKDHWRPARDHNWLMWDCLMAAAGEVSPVVVERRGA